jgi:peptide/nickel transport system substrate-binding protein
LVAVVTIGAVGLVGCAQGSGGGGGSGKDITIRVATTDSVTSLDPAGAYDVGSRTVLANLYQTLLTIIPG